MTKDLSNVLSERETEVLQLVAQGFANKEIARELFLSPNTIKVHLRNIYGKLGVSSRTEAMMVAVREGWVIVEEEIAEADTAPAASQPFAPIARWQRIFLLGALLLLIVALAWTWPLSTPVEELSSCPLLENQGPVELAGPPSLPSRWRRDVPLSIARGRLAVVSVDELIYAIGGEMPGGGFTGVVEVYDPVRQSWDFRATKPLPVANIGGAALNGKIYVPGGLTFAGQVTEVMEVYDPVADRWGGAASLPAPRAAYALAAHNGKLYLFGGTDGQRDVDTVLIYDPLDDEWREGVLMPSARAFAAAAALNERIYVVGGYADGRELDTCRVYLPASDEWQSCAPMREGRGGLSLVAVGSNLFAIGGGWENYLAYNQQYDPSQDTWLRFETPVSGRWRNAGAAEIDGKVYVIGGWSEEFLNLNLSYQAVYKSFIPSVSR